MNSDSLAKKRNSRSHIPTFLDQVDEFAGRYGSGICHIVDSERDALSPASTLASTNSCNSEMEFVASRRRRVAHELGEVVAGMLELIEGNADAPDVNIRVRGENFFTESLGSAIEGTVVLAEGEIGSVIFSESRTVRSCSRVDAARRNVAPRHIGSVASLGNDSWQDGVAGEAFGLDGSRMHPRWAFRCILQH